MMWSRSMWVLYDPKPNLRLFSHTEFRGFVSTPRETSESLWEEFFRDPSQFNDVRSQKRSLNSPDFRHKFNGKALWIDGFYNPPWVHAKFRRMGLPIVAIKVNDDRHAIIQLVKSCGKKKDISTIRKICADKAWITKDMTTAATIIRSYAKCGALKEAREVFDQLAEPNVVCWTALISGYADQGFGKEALICFMDMQRKRVKPNSVTYICALKACVLVGALDTVEEIHARVRDQGILNEDIVLGNTLLVAYAKCGAVTQAQKVFEQLPETDVVSWNALIAGYVDQGLGEEALRCFREMQRNRVIPDSVTYLCTLKACSIVGAFEIVEEIYACVKEQGLLNKHILLGSTLVDSYAKCGAVKEAREVFEQLEEPNVISWTTLIAGYSDQGFGEEAIAGFREMQRNKVVPDLVTYVCTLKACAIVGNVALVKEIHACVRDKGLMKKDIVLGNMLVNAYAKCGSVEDAKEVFDQLPDPDVVSWTALIAGYAENDFGEEALACFREMQKNNVVPDTTSYSCALKACAIVGSLEIVEEIHVQVKDEGLLDNDIILGSALIDAYAKCGAVKEAQDVFNKLAEVNGVSWNALIAGYAKVGRVIEMLELFSRMIVSGAFPDSVTYTVLLNGCSHGALLDEGLSVFGLIGTHGVAWTMEHYTCMVDLFGRAGLFDKARCFVLDHRSTLLAFLGACLIWVDVDHGRWAFEKLLQLDQKSTSAYVCMSNIYAAAGMLKEADEIEFLRVKEKASKQSELLLKYERYMYLKLEQLYSELMKEDNPLDLHWLLRPTMVHEENVLCSGHDKLSTAFALIDDREDCTIDLNGAIQ